MFLINLSYAYQIRYEHLTYSELVALLFHLMKSKEFIQNEKLFRMMASTKIDRNNELGSWLNHLCLYQVRQEQYMPLLLQRYQLNYHLRSDLGQ